MVRLHLSLVILCYLCTIKQFNFMIVPNKEFNVKQDIQQLNKILHSVWSFKNNTIIDIISNRSLSQRLKIEEEYDKEYKEEFTIQLKKKIKEHLFRETVLMMMKPVENVLASELNDAILKNDSNETVLIEIMSVLTSSSMQLVSEYYKLIFGRELIDDLRNNLNGQFQYLCLCLHLEAREELEKYTNDTLKSVTKTLYNNGETKSENYKFQFIMILVKKDNKLLRNVFAEYKKLASEDIEDTINREFTEDIICMEGLLSLVKSIRNRNAYFAERLHDAITGRETFNRTLKRIIVTRSEIDIDDIKTTFRKKYGSSLEQWIMKNTDGFYQNILSRIITATGIVEADSSEEFEYIIVSNKEFNVKNDIEQLNITLSSMQGINQYITVNIISQRSLSQRLKIEEEYKKEYKEELEILIREKIEDPLFRKIVLLMMKPVENVLALEVHDAIFKNDSNETVLIEIMGVLTSSSMQLIKNEYKKIFKRELIDDLRNNLNGHFQYLCLSLHSEAREELKEYTDDAVISVTKALYKNGIKKSEDDKSEDDNLEDDKSEDAKSKFIKILVKNDYELLRNVFVEYKELAFEDIEDMINREFSDDIICMEGLLSLVKSIRDRSAYFAERLYNAMSGTETIHRTLMRIIVTRSEVDIYEIRKTFKKKYNRSLTLWIQSKTWGYYELMLYRIITTNYLIGAS